MISNRLKNNETMKANNQFENKKNNVIAAIYGENTALHTKCRWLGYNVMGFPTEVYDHSEEDNRRHDMEIAIFTDELTGFLVPLLRDNGFSVDLTEDEMNQMLQREGKLCLSAEYVG